MGDLALISCGALKREGTHPAQELYCGELFTKASAYAKAKGWNFAILSSCYGLALPDQPIQCYDLRIMSFSKREREAWGEKVVRSLRSQNLASSGDTVHFLAGKHYVEPVKHILEREGVTCTTPLKGMGIGQQLSFLRRVGA